MDTFKLIARSFWSIVFGALINYGLAANNVQEASLLSAAAGLFFYFVTAPAFSDKN